ncbi:scavenger receptor cysteine-rich domain superfamily protein-like [Porites lutea]|uniref:scavenger receptor cysteine-rich domain superfamily protein-like n=1 Tax=Porites lutea TaxID=51062 RepID=UPI003CC658EC
MARLAPAIKPLIEDNLIRLQGYTIPYAGRVEVFYSGVWGAISSSNWDINDATVVCRQLGYSAGAEVALTNDVYGLISGPVWITNLQCNGSESNVMECVHDGLGKKTELQHRAYTASVICKDSSFTNVMPIRLRGSHSPNMGRIEVHFAGTWGSVSASGWDIEDATVACRQLGYHSPSLSGSRIFCSSDIPMWFTHFTCFGNETSLEQCARDFYQHSSSTYCASVVCTEKMTKEAPELRLSDSPVPHAGRVELRFKGIWGTIFQHDWYYTLRPGATRVICRQLGFSDAVISAGYSVYGSGVGPVWLASLDLRGCLGHEKNILNCSYSSPRFTTYYGHSNDASVVCKPNTSHTGGK